MTKKHSSLSWIRITFIGSTLFIAALFIYFFIQVKNLIDSSDWVNHTNQVSLSLEKISLAASDLVINQENFLLIGDSSFLIKRDSAFKALTQELNTVNSLVEDNPAQLENVRILRAAINKKLLNMTNVIPRNSPRRSSHEFTAGISEEIQNAKAVRQIVNKMALNEIDLLQHRTLKYSSHAFITRIFIVVLFLGASTILLISYFRIDRAYHRAKNLEEIVRESSSKLNQTLISNKKLEESDQRFRNLIYTSPSAIGILYGEDLKITIANEPIINIWGKGKEIIGKSYFEALPELEEQGYKEVFAEVYKTGVPFNAVETPVHLLQNGVTTLKYYNFILYPMRDINNEVNGIGIIATEVTSQALLNNMVKESEQQYRELSLSLEEKVKERTAELQKINSALKFSEDRYHRMVVEVQDYAIILLNKDGIIENWNKGAEKIKGYKAEEIIGKSFANFYSTEAQANRVPQRLLAEAIEKGKSSDENWRIRKDGSKFWGSVVITALRDDKADIIGFVKVTRDLTERKLAEEESKVKTQQLEINNMKLEKINKELQSFAYISSHDLQEPLRKIQTFASRILEKEESNLSEDGKHKFKRMQEAAKRMQTLINDLLAYSRINTAEPSYETTDLLKIINEVKEDLKEDLNEKHATVEVTGLQELNAIPFQFRQLMHNLIGNSLKFSNPGNPPQIKINTRLERGAILSNKLSPLKNYFHISVTDNGIGFDQQYSEQIFEVFQRLHGKMDYNGTGIGLAIVKKIVENHGGFVSATGEVDKGATSNIYIPA